MPKASGSTATPCWVTGCCDLFQHQQASYDDRLHQIDHLAGYSPEERRIRESRHPYLKRWMVCCYSNARIA